MGPTCWKPYVEMNPTYWMPYVEIGPTCWMSYVEMCILVSISNIFVGNSFIEIKLVLHILGGISIQLKLYMIAFFSVICVGYTNGI